MFHVLPCEPVISHCQMCMAQKFVLAAVERAQQALKRHDLLRRIDATAFSLRIARCAVVVLVALLGEHDRLAEPGGERQDLLVEPLVPLVGHELNEVFVRIRLDRIRLR